MFEEQFAIVRATQRVSHERADMLLGNVELGKQAGHDMSSKVGIAAEHGALFPRWPDAGTKKGLAAM
jgi:hypothetical protein